MEIIWFGSATTLHELSNYLQRKMFVVIKGLHIVDIMPQFVHPFTITNTFVGWPQF